MDYYIHQSGGLIQVPKRKPTRLLKGLLKKCKAVDQETYISKMREKEDFKKQRIKLEVARQIDHYSEDDIYFYRNTAYNVTPRKWQKFVD